MENDTKPTQPKSLSPIIVMGLIIFCFTFIFKSIQHKLAIANDWVFIPICILTCWAFYIFILRVYKAISNIWVIIFFILSSSTIMNAQDTIFYDQDWNEIHEKQLTGYYQVLHKDVKDSMQVDLETFYGSGNIKKKVHYTDYDKKIKNGLEIEWYETGKIKSTLTHVDGKINGELFTYWGNGNIKRKDFYENDSLIIGHCFDESGKEIPYFDYMIKPQYPGGSQAYQMFLRSNLKYPPKARKKGIEGRVLVRFKINKTGKISEVTILENAHPDLEKEALRVVNKMPDWIPGKQDGDFVSVYFSLPVTFRLE